MNRFFVEAKNKNVGDSVIIDKEGDVRHALSALRLRKGDYIELCFLDYSVFCARIIDISKRSLSVDLTELIDDGSDQKYPKIDLFQGVPKGKKLDYIVQKSVECGVHAIVPVEMKRCVAKIVDARESSKLARLNEIALSAAQQSKRFYQPKVMAPMNLNQMLSALKNYDLVILADEEERKKTLKDLQTPIAQSDSIAVVIGPEGGISDDERLALSSLAQSISLGKNILRTETAPVFLLAQIAYILSDS